VFVRALIVRLRWKRRSLYREAALAGRDRPFHESRLPVCAVGKPVASD
jgi:hypothetical protein